MGCESQTQWNNINPSFLSSKRLNLHISWSKTGRSLPSNMLSHCFYTFPETFICPKDKKGTVMGHAFHILYVYNIISLIRHGGRQYEGGSSPSCCLQVLWELWQLSATDCTWMFLNPNFDSWDGLNLILNNLIILMPNLYFTTVNVKNDNDRRHETAVSVEECGTEASLLCSLVCKSDSGRVRASPASNLSTPHWGVQYSMRLLVPGWWWWCCSSCSFKQQRSPYLCAGSSHVSAWTLRSGEQLRRSGF